HPRRDRGDHYEAARRTGGRGHLRLHRAQPARPGRAGGRAQVPGGGGAAMTDVDQVAAAARAGGDAGRWPGKLSARDRVGLLLDPGSWCEDGLLAGAATTGLPADGVLTGTGTVEGRPVAVIAHDFTVKAGSWGALTCEKQIRILERADRDLL